MTEKHAVCVLETIGSGSTLANNDDKAPACIIAIKAIDTVEKIKEVIKLEQQNTSCEYTKLKSFEMIEKIISDYQLSVTE